MNHARKASTEMSELLWEPFLASHSKLSLIAFSLLLVLSGCDQQRQQLADLIARPTPEEIAVRIDQSVAQSKAEKGIEVGESYLKSEKDPNGHVHKALVKAYLFVGDASSAQKHIELSVSGSTSSNSAAVTTTPTPKKDQALTGDSVSVTVSQNGTAVSATTTNSSTQKIEQSVSVDGASVTVGPNGTVVKAGDSVVSIKN